MKTLTFFLEKCLFKIVGLLLFPASLCASLQSVPQLLTDALWNITSQPGKDGYLYTSYQLTVECKSAFPALQPTTIEELQDIVRYALKNNYKVKPIGSLHSITDIICTDGIPVAMKNIKHFSFDPTTNYATAGAGLELQDFLEYIHDRGRALTVSPSYGGITLGGAVGTGAHGTSLKLETTLSDQLVSITFVDGLGNIRKSTEKDEDFKALKVNLGLLGIVFELVFITTEQYKLKIRNYAVDDDILWKEGEIIRMAKNNDWFQFFWFPTNKKVVLSVGNRVPINSTGNCMSNMDPDISIESAIKVLKTLEYMQEYGDQVGFFLVQSYNKLALYQKVPGRTPLFTKEDGSTSCLPLAVGYSHRMSTNRCKNCPWPIVRIDEGAAILDVLEFSGTMKTLKEIMGSNLVSYPFTGIIFRFLTDSDAYLGLSNGRKSFAVEWVSIPRADMTQPRLGIEAVQLIGQAMFKKPNARPHWGKNGLYYTNPEILRRAHPNLPKFMEVMNRMDPQEVFMNDFGRRLKHGTYDMTLTAAARKRCGLNEACVCQKDSDCGDESLLALICSDVNEFKICKKRSNLLNEAKEATARVIINFVVKFTDDVGYVVERLSRYKGFGNEEVVK